jgi:hypothetical protein
VVCSLTRNGRIPVQLLNPRINRNPLDVATDVSFSKPFGHQVVCPSYIPPSPHYSGLHLKVTTAIPLLRKPFCHKGRPSRSIFDDLGPLVLA